jgi:anti-sigma-K factor RskA
LIDCLFLIASYFFLVKEATEEEEEEDDPEATIPVLATASSSDGHIKLWKLDPRPENPVSTGIIPYIVADQEPQGTTERHEAPTRVEIGMHRISSPF